MWYIIAALITLIAIVGTATYIRKRKRPDEEDEINAPDAECCGAHEVCEKGLKRADEKIDYFEDEDLDEFKAREADSYTDTEIERFRDVLYTLKQKEIEEWLISLEKREIQLPLILRQEAVEMIYN